MGMGRSHEGCDGLSWERGVIAESPAPGDETKILESRHRPADVTLAPPGSRHAVVPFSIRLQGFLLVLNRRRVL
jgi:hypothetical protein